MKKLIIMIKSVLICLFSVVCALSQITNLGTITSKNSIGWDGSSLADGYNLYAAPTNGVAYSKIASVTTTNCPGILSTNLEGAYQCYATAVNINGESKPSTFFLVTFRAGIPQPPTNFRLFTVLNLLATNSLPSVMAPPPIR